ncbi:hypothetical protein ICE98_01132 [Lactococcus lactis]|nr:hypothetical protein [Lactococcus lactis]
MYRSKHQKGYTTSHEVKTTRFRTWKSGKKWVYAFMAFSLLAGDIGSIPLLQHGQEQIVHAATSSSGTLVPNSPASTNKINVLAGDVSTATNWTTSKLTGAGYGSGHPPQVADGQVGLGLRLQAQHKPMRSVF